MIIMTFSELNIRHIMNNTSRSLALMASVTALLSACSTTSPTLPIAQTKPVEQARPADIQQPSLSESMTKSGITLEQIMANQDWLGRRPLNPSWAVNGDIVFERKQQGGKLRDVYSISLDEPKDIRAVGFDRIHEYQPDEQVTSADGALTVWRYDESVYLRDQNGDIKQLTRGGAPLRNFAFLRDGRLTAQEYDSIVAIDLATGQRQSLLSWVFGQSPVAVKAPQDFIAQEQVELIDYVATRRADRQAASDRKGQITAQNSTLPQVPFYFDANEEMVAVEISPSGDHAIFVTKAKTPARKESDIMPHYVQEDGRIATKNVRARVADAKPVNETIWLLDLVNDRRYKLGYETLPGFNEDVLASVKREVAALKGEKYTNNRLPRAIRLIDSWNWAEPSIQWHSDGKQVALMLEAWDNKDRWIATVDFDKKALVSQHRLHDDAWINYRYNDFGWLAQTDTLYFLSEQTGYSHLYVQELGEAPRAMTSGDYVVDSPVVTSDGKYAYFKANKDHPGIYEVYRVNLESGEHLALTDFDAMVDFSLSPDEQSLLLTHSTTVLPPELYIKAVNSEQAPMKLTDTVSDQYLDMAWTAPKIVAIPSTHTDQPIYARLYLPKDVEKGDKRKAVVFNHGAGYLQNAHLGWSGYQREFMFHSMLAEQGYVVLDMDYRASAGYGRDWRTAIYRQMGTPEVEDLIDGVNWLVEHANVDRERIGTYGGSYGGFLTFMAMFNEPDLFQAGAALRPVSDWAHYNIGYTSNILNTPDIDPIAYRRSSPIYFAQGLQKPLLINAPMVDSNVFFVDVVRLVQRLIELEKQDFETAIYPVESHGFVQPSSWLDEYRRIYKLFETHL